MLAEMSIEDPIRSWRQLFARARLVAFPVLFACATAAQPRTAPPFTPLYREAVDRREKEFGPAHPKTADGLTNLALFLERSGDLASAEPLLRRSLAIYERAYGPRDARIASGLLNLGSLL